MLVCCRDAIASKNIYLVCKKEELNLQLQQLQHQKTDCRVASLEASPLVPKYQCQYTHLDIGQLGDTWSRDPHYLLQTYCYQHCQHF